jgi:predicted GNAT superfamily acetyltransferase
MSENFEFTIRSLTRPDELVWVTDLQDQIRDDGRFDVPLTTMIDFARNGGQIIGAFDGKLLVGFLIAFLGTDSRDPHRPAMANLKLVLDRIGVHPDYRNVGLATQMTLRLRDISTKQGIRLTTYAFDPLNSREANLMIRKLGAIVKHHMPDYYGIREDLSLTDCLIAEWWITHNRVEERLFGNRGNLTLEQYLKADTPIINPTYVNGTSDNQVKPYLDGVTIPEKSLMLVEIPTDFSAIMLTNPTLAIEWQYHVRDVFLTIITSGFVATDFLYEQYENRQRSFYLMSFDGPRLTLSL